MTEFFTSAEPDPVPVKEKFDYHTIALVLPAGEGEGLRLDIKCKGADKEDCSCNSDFCNLEDIIQQVGWSEAIRAAADIPLSRVSARVDWSDPEEPYIDVEP